MTKKHLNSSPLPRLLRLAPVAFPLLAVPTFIATLLLHPTLSLRTTRILGSPITAGSPFTWRIILTNLDLAESQPVTSLPMQVRFEHQGHACSFQGTTDATGSLETSCSLPTHAPTVDIQILAGASPTLEQHHIPLSTTEWRTHVQRLPALIATHDNNNITVQVFASRARIAASFQEQMLLRISDPDRSPLSNVTIELSASGAEVTPSQLESDAKGEAWFTLQPTFNVASLTLRRSDPHPLNWTLELPIESAALWLEQTPDTPAQVRIHAPTSHPTAHLTLFSEDSRLYASTVSLDAKGVGVATLPEAAFSMSPLWLLLSANEPDLTSSPQTAWPLQTRTNPWPNDSARFRPMVLVDTRPAALETLRERAKHQRTQNVMTIAVICLLEAAFLGISLVLASRDSRQGCTNLEPELEQQLQVSLTDSTYAPRVLLALVLAIASFSAFVYVALLG